MGLLDKFEGKLDDLVNGPFRRAFKDVVEPVEIAARLNQEMDKRAAIISRGRTVVPNSFTVELSTHDVERLSELIDPIRFEFISVLREHATEQRYTFLGPVEVPSSEDPALDTGEFRVSSETKPETPMPGQPAAPLGGNRFAGHPHLIVGNKTYQLTKSSTTIGRGTGADIAVDDVGVSRNHAVIVLGIPSILRDLGSTNGTSLDGRKVAESPLHDGAQITIGNTTMTFRSG